jgi:hypothetical protein
MTLTKYSRKVYLIANIVIYLILQILIFFLFIGSQTQDTLTRCCYARIAFFCAEGVQLKSYYPYER